MMSRALKKNSELSLNGSLGITNFEIVDILGAGGSCIAYFVSYNENGSIPHKGILKEYCPVFLENFKFQRDGNTVMVPHECKDEFEQGIINFKNTYKVINEYLAENVSASNFHPVQLGLYEGNNTVYSLTSCDYGKSYDKINDVSMLEIMKLILSVAKAVEMYHNVGYLHLDIKPKNILVLDDVTDLVKLFDFDSLTSIQLVNSREASTMPIPEDYYVPELNNFQLKNIGIQTDIYEIGAMAYSRIFKKNTTIDDIYSIEKIDIDKSDFAVGISPQAKYEIANLFKSTLQISRWKRYSSISDLKAQLEKIISLLNDHIPYPLDMPKWQPTANYVGRENELLEIKKRLDTDGYVFVRGIGGLGKSEIAKMFVKSFSEEYHTVQFCEYTDSLRMVLASMPFDGINDNDYRDFNELVNSKNKALHLCDEHTLIVIDNFNVTYDDFLRSFLPANNKSFKVIFTTRCKPASDYYEKKVFDLPRLSEEDCQTIFRIHSLLTASEENDKQIEQIIRKIDYNTLIIILTARIIRKTGISISEMIKKFDDQELINIDQKVFHEYDISNAEIEVYNTMYAHLNAIFDVSALSDTQKEVLKNFTLISAEGIAVEDFVCSCDKPIIDKNCVFDLSDWGWISIDADEVITMHPIVSDIISENELIKKEDSYYSLAEALEEYCNPDYLSHITIVMDRLSCAIQLERRYKNEDVFKRCMISAKLGRMYQNAFFPAEAKKYLLKALNIAETEKSSRKLPDSYKYHKDIKEKMILKKIHFICNPNKMLIPYIYYFLGDFEKSFGTGTAAIDYYKKSIASGKKIGFIWIIVASKTEIAECYSDNNNLKKAYKEYVAAFKYARLFRLKDYLSSIASNLSDVCAQLELDSERRKYEKYAEKFEVYDEDGADSDGLEEFTDAINSGDYGEVNKKYEEWLSMQRETLGESSPMYKTYSQNRWIFYIVNKQKAQALRYLNEAIAFISSTYGEYSMELANNLAVAALTMPELGEFGYAYEFANRAVDICNRNGESTSYTYCQAKLALVNVSLVTGKTHEAENYMNDIDFSPFSGNDFLEDMIQTAGMCLSNLSRYEELESMCLNLLSKNNAGNIAKFQANILMSISKEQKGDLEEAEKYANESTRYLEFIKAANVKAGWMVQYYRACARLYYRRGENELAIKKIDEMLELFDESEKDEFSLYSAYLERGLYNSFSNNNAAAMLDFERCEKILKENNLPKEAYFVLYNNIAIGYQRIHEYEKSMDYLNKAAEVNPLVFNPTSYYETLVCGNIGWLSYLLGDVKNSEKYINIAIKSLKKFGLEKSREFFLSKCNLAYVYIAKRKCEKALETLFDIRQQCHPASDASGEYARHTCEGILRAYFGLDQAQEAYEFACEEIENLEQWFGKYSLVRINGIMEIGYLFRINGYTDSYDFFLLAEELLCDSEQTKTIQYALALNYIGVCKTDFDKKHSEAGRYFEEAKALFEELGETDNRNYIIVLKNIDYISMLKIEEMIKKRAGAFSDSGDDN